MKKLVLGLLFTGMLSFALSGFVLADAMASPSPTAAVTASPSVTAQASAGVQAAATATANAQANAQVQAAMQAAATARRTANLQSQQALLKCSITYTLSVISAEDPMVPGAQLSTYSTALTADMATLDASAAAGDSKAYYSFRAHTFNKDYSQAQSATRKAREALSATVLATLKTSNDAAKATALSCRLSALQQQAAAARVADWTADIANKQAAATKAQSNGVNMAATLRILANANTQIIAPFQAAVSSATDATTANAAFAQYCLYGGCPKGTNFHLDAQYAIAFWTAQSAYAATLPNANNADAAAAIASANAHLSTAASVLASVGAGAYAKGQSEQIFSEISQAYRSIYTARKIMARANVQARVEQRKDAQQARQEAREQRRNNGAPSPSPSAASPSASPSSSPSASPSPSSSPSPTPVATASVSASASVSAGAGSSSTTTTTILRGGGGY